MEQDTFEFIRSFPDPTAQEKYDGLIGIDHIKKRLAQEALIVLNPKSIGEWSNKFYKKEIELVKVLKRRPPLFIFSGDVGTGKTALAESFADQVARAEKVEVTLYKLSLNARGSGIVGEMTKLISQSFDKLRHDVQTKAGAKSAKVLFIDEADALAQSREAIQMHHEDKAGVNALIRGVDSVQGLPVPVLVVMCTNRFGALDPAIRRRSAVTFEFVRPSREQCLTLLKTYLSETGITDEQLDEAASMCVPHGSLGYGYTYSDITQKVLPSSLLGAFPDKPIGFKMIIETIKDTPPTAPFSEYAGE